MRASADPAADFSRALRFAPRLYPSHPSSSTRSNELERTDGRNTCAGASGATNSGRLASLCASPDRDLLASLLSEHIVFRSPFVQSPIPGRAATLLVLTTVVQIFENFRYHRAFVAGPHDVALEFAANIGKWQLKGIDLIRFNESGEMVEFEVMIRPIKALAALGEAMGNRIGPQLSRLKEAAAASR